MAKPETGWASVEAGRRQAPSGAADDPLLSRRAYDTLFAAIQNGRLRPGSRVREAELTAWLEMSRTPLRDALQRLESEGLLQMQPHRGILIARLDRQAIGELYAAREWEEGMAAALAARNASDAEVAGLRRILDLEREAAGEPTAGSRHNRMLHEVIYDCTRNRYLIAHLRALFALLALAGNATRRDAARVAAALREHTELVDAIADHDPARAQACARRHIAAAQHFVMTSHASGED